MHILNKYPPARLVDIYWVKKKYENEKCRTLVIKEKRDSFDGGDAIKFIRMITKNLFVRNASVRFCNIYSQ